MERRPFVLGGIAWALAPRALAQAKPLRIAVPGDANDAGNAGFLKRIEKGLADAGIHNVEVRGFHGRDTEDGVGAVREALAWRPDALFVAGPMMAQAARDGTRTIPVVFFGVPEPESFGLMQSLARPGGNITGRGLNSAAGTLKRLEVIPEILPRARRVALFFRDPRRGQLLERVRSRLGEAARDLKLELEDFEVGAGGGFSATLARISQRPPDAMVPFGPYAWNPDGGRVDPNTAFIEFERRVKAPVILESEHAVRQGACIALYDAGGQLGPAISMLARVLKGESPATMPVEFPVRFHLAVNRGAARAIGLLLPASVVVRADVVVD